VVSLPIVKKLLLTFGFGLLLTLPALSDHNDPPPQFVVGRLEVTNRDSWAYWPPYYPWNPPWHHDFPDADLLLVNLLHELTGIQTGGEEAIHVVRLDSPDVFKYPFVYLSEPGFLQLTDKEIANLGEYIRRGGFIMADDFRTAAFLHGPEELEVLRYYLKRAVPERELVRLDLSHPVFHSFFDIDTLDMTPPYPIPASPEFWGMSDEDGNLQLVANYNNDIGDFWRYLEDGQKPLKDSTRSVRIGIDYVIYAMTH
jgi:Domain of unknown function (DUF4159)